MKLTIKLIALAFVVSFAACKGSGDKKDGAKTEYAESNKDDANDIVEYNNVLVSYTDKNNDYLKSLDGTLQKISKGLENPTDRFAWIGITSPMSMISINHSKVKPETPPAALSSDDQKFFKDNVAGLSSTMTKIKDTYKALNDYIKAEDWKDDKSAKGKLLVDSIYSMSKKYYAYDDKILAKLEVIGDDAERIILKSHPLKEYIFALKDDKKAVDDFNKLLAENAGKYKAAEAKIKTAYAALEAQNAKHKIMSPPDAKKFPGQDGSFTRFNESFSDYLIEARKIMRDASASGKISDDDGESLVRKQDYMRTAYNNFVD
ncbi:DUF3829 domain-containing protein [Pedobacter punctiformis]|uniref:DUF3829 domain-containing protein n=1 Tax=Pedobacter punctiformis TaxID=3004097 RepID=A0ABT4L923_9SPHI|nr:DUF3829 domain-containing protein [Pedobacter sp. HCMS5-2]MCZ4244425.1 DUF3829 domain-containing protein [Pedobacter sp. HCMS5-2]